MALQLYIFDLDGTLVDSFQDIAASVNQTFERMELPVLTHEQIKAHVGKGARWLLEECLRDVGADPTATLALAREHFLPIYTKHLAVYTKAYPQVFDVLKSLQNQGKTLAVCTNKPIGLAKPLLHKLGLDIFFEQVLGGDSLPTKKPDPAPLLQIMKTLNIEPSETIMVGDSRFDIEAGRAAQTWTCGVTYGHHSAVEMATHAPDCTIHSFADLLSFHPEK